MVPIDPFSIQDLDFGRRLHRARFPWQDSLSFEVSILTYDQEKKITPSYLAQSPVLFHEPLDPKTGLSYQSSSRGYDKYQVLDGVYGIKGRNPLVVIASLNGGPFV